MSPLTQAIWRGGLGLGVFAVVTAGLIALTQQATDKRIEEEIAKSRAKALYSILPAALQGSEILRAEDELTPEPLLGLERAGTAYLAGQRTESETLILPFVAEEGYTGPIAGIVGIQPDGTIQGVRVTAHKETPGLGDKIELQKSDWILQFEGKSLSAPYPEEWEVKKDGGEFDQLTGATITSRALVRSVADALRYYDTNQQTLQQHFQQPEQLPEAEDMESDAAEEDAAVTRLSDKVTEHRGSELANVVAGSDKAETPTNLNDTKVSP